MEAISLRDLAKAVHMSPSYLSRQLVKETGMGFGEMLARIRIVHAKELLQNGTSAKTASYLVGFRDQSYFTKVFTRFEGISPSRYLEALRSE